MSKTDQVLIIEPQHELKFVGSFKSPITSYIKLTNPSDKTIGFKIKTTAPKKYCVRPNSGVLEPEEFTNIAVSLQALDFDQSEKNKHKFMVQSIFVPDRDYNLESLWKDVKEDAVMGTKLKCVFERKESNTVGTGPAVEASSAVLSNSAPSHEDKNKRIGDSPSIHHQDGELQKAAKEVKQLREDESSLRHENMMLKEEVLRLQLLCKSEGHSQSVPMRSSMAQQAAQPVQPVMVIIAIVVCMVGIVLGKFIL
ncbi:vesicle-associated membrane protein-associated protein A-like [Thrips palmi]|uniref:Vesicle-associated membrane protein-associated protein A-like n=1 Tax=Thrips palmi TaxID=161013 RepID=A0A6P8ZHY5_THRPL|nr:vesicle-associated membrane protein-associated protein A-like [Thrips palmi]